MPETEPADGGVDVDLQHVSSVVLGALVVAAVAAWVTAELAGPALVFPAVALVAGYLLNGRRGDRAKFVFVGYALVSLLAVSPVLFFLPDVLAGRSGQLSQTMAVVVTRLLLLVAGTVGYVVYRLAGGPGVVTRARDPDRRPALAGYVVAAVLLLLPFVLFVMDIVLGASALASLGVLGWRLLGLVAVAVAYAAYRLDGGRGVVDRVQATAAE